MAVLERSELDASPLADLHAIATQLGLDGFRRLRKADLIDAILERSGGEVARGGDAGGNGAVGADEEAADRKDADEEGEQRSSRRRRPSRARRAKASAEVEEQDVGEVGATEDSTSDVGEQRIARGSRGEGRGERAGRGSRGEGRGERAGRGSRGEGGGEERAGRGSRGESREERIAEGVVELLGNGSAFLRVSPPEASDEDVYISAAQVRRCELVSGDRVSGPVRTPRHSERYPSLARVDTINGASAESVAEGTRYEDLPAAHPAERLELDGQDPTLGAIEWLTPIGRGSRVTIVGASRSGKTETLRRLLGALVGREGLEVVLVLSGARPEEIAAWREGPVAPAAALDLAASPDLQGQTVAHVVDTAKRVAARGGDAVVLIDSLDGLHPHAARRVLAGARNLAEGGSLTVIATATRPLGGESTVIALDVALTSTGRIPALDLPNSGTLRPELLVGEDGARAITDARAAAMAH
ncbi:MAG TPA: Rho termination factor N-terminal domain-containing protein [Solirubrobacteraceae bacterium]|jgi:transcription termination factor Rho|nr:Rho termination factor N-terminal domain-containing protein [Solirubrobacteraceae bacterium]